MIPLQSLLNSLQAWAQEELAGQRRMLALIERQVDGLVRNAPAELLAATQALEPELAQQAERVDKRRRIFQNLAAHWKVQADALSLGSILERCGGHEPLARLRTELRRSTAELVRRNRRFAALAAAQGRMLEELVAALLQHEDPRLLERGGSLVDAEA